jgi:hypothetical protein
MAVPTRVLPLSSIVLFAAALAAQQPGLFGSVGEGAAVASACGVTVDPDGAPRADGPDYTARFAAGAMEFVPALGTGAPEAMPLRYRLLAVGRGHDLAPVAGEVAYRHHDRRIAAERRPGVVERFDATTRGVELSYEFPSPLPGSGDLVVRAAVATSLPFVGRGEGGELLFVGAHGGVGFGAVTGVDASGRTCAGQSRWVDGQLEWSLPAAFVATARYPLVLDPLVGAVILPAGSGNDEDGQTASAYEESVGYYLVVWRRAFASTWSDVRGQMVGNNGALIGAPLTITTGALRNDAPVVAVVKSRQAFVVCWQYGPSTFGPWDVHARQVTPAGALGPIATVANTTNNETRPTICGVRSAAGSRALVAWSVEGGMPSARTLDLQAGGTLVPGVVQPLASANAHDLLLPKGRNDGQATILMSRGFGYVHLQPLSSDAVPLGTGATLLVGAGGSMLTGTAAIDGDGQRFVVVHSENLTATTIDWDGATMTIGASVPLGPTGTGTKAIGFLGERYLCAYEVLTQNPFDSDLACVAFKPDLTICSPVTTIPSAARPNQQRPVIATHWAASSSIGHALVAWGESYVPPFAQTVAALRYQPMLGAPPVSLGGGCGGGGTAGTNGPFSPGNEQFQFTLSGGDPTAPFAILGLGLGDPPIPCGCTFTNSLVTFAMFANQGSASFAWPVPCDPQFLGFLLEFQWLLYGAAQSPCSAIPTLVGSDRVQLTITQ